MKIRGKKIQVRFPTAPPSKVHGAKKGKKAYNRQEARLIERNAQKDAS